MRSRSRRSVDGAHRGLRALVVDVPALEVLQRRRVHHHQRRVDDRSGVHQRTRERVATGVDGGEGAANDGQRPLLAARRVHAGRQAHRAHRDVDLARTVLASQVRQRSGLGPGDPGRVAGGADDLGHRVAAERAGCEEHDLAVDQMRRHRPGDVLLGRGRRRQHDQLGPAQRRADVGAGGGDRHLAAAGGVLEDDAAVAGQRRGVAAPQAHGVAGLGQVGGGGVGAVAATQDRNVHRGVFEGGSGARQALGCARRAIGGTHYFSLV